MVNMILDEKMPLKSYTLFHPDAKLTAADIKTLKDYAISLNPSVYHDTVAIHEAKSQFTVAAEKRDRSEEIMAATGVVYPKDFRSWEVISTTNRFDNNRSLRVIYGNKIAATAVRNNQFDPWPEGSVIVKVVWDIIEEKNGDVLPGKFNNVQVMEKNSGRFKDTKGWGFAKFTGIGLVPYGKTAAYNNTCFNCHKAASETGYVFNIPLPDGDQILAKTN